MGIDQHSLFIKFYKKTFQTSKKSMEKNSIYNFEGSSIKNLLIYKVTIKKNWYLNNCGKFFRVTKFWIWNKKFSKKWKNWE